MKIEVGDTVELNNGEAHRVDRMIGDDPDRVNSLGYGPFVINGNLYHQDGRFADYGSWHDLSVKRIISRASGDDPKLWRNMTDEEKGALLLAHREDASLQIWNHVAEVWRDPQIWEILFQNDRAYRVNPVAACEPIKIQGPSGEILGSGTMLRRDGEWDFDSIEVDTQPDTN